MVRKWGEQITRSRQYAAGLALIVAFLSYFNLPIIGWLSSIIIALVTLQNGARQGFVIVTWAILPAVAMLCLGQNLVFFNAFAHYLVVWGLAVMLRKNNSWINIIQLVSLIEMLAICAVYYFAPDVQNWLINQLVAVAREYKAISIFNLHPGDFDLWIKYIGVFATGLLALAIILINLMVLFFARWWQSSITPMVNIQKECYSIRMHYLSSLLLLALGVGLYINSNLMINVLVVALVPFVIAGLSLLHAYSATKKNGNVIMFIFYVLFIFLSPYFVMFLSLMGWLDSFINFRKKFVADNVIAEE